jgi:hypothetical protein
MSTNHIQIESPDKYGWQEILKTNEHYYEDKNGLNLVMASTGTGKTKAQYHRISHFRDLVKQSVTVYVPNNCKFLTKQIKEEFINYLIEDGIVYDIKIQIEKIGKIGKIGIIYTITLGTFKCIIKPFIANTKSPESLLKIHDHMNPMIIDEFDGIQTQFGLTHGGYHSESTISSNKANWGKTGFNFLERLCNQTTVDGFSATLDGPICKDLLPYEGKINMNYFIIIHNKDSLSNLPIIYIKREKMVHKIIKFYHKGIKTLVFVERIEDMDELTNILDDNGVSYYKWNSKTGEELDTVKIESNIISIFVNGPSRGLNIPSIKRIVLYRGLKASTKDDQTLLSALANQIMGRIRNGGKIYRDETTVKNKADCYYDLVEEIYETTNDTEYLRKFWRCIMRHTYENDFKDNIVRLFINKWIRKEFHGNARRGDSISQRFKRKYYDNEIYLTRIKELQKCIHDKKCDDEFISNYLSLETEMMVQYEKDYLDLMKIDSEKMFIKGSNTTGGGHSKPNISDAEKEKGYTCMIDAIKNCKLNGSLLTRSTNKRYDGEFMHAKSKSTLSNIERTKSKYAIPMIHTLECGLNQQDKNTELFSYDKINGITINYSNFESMVEEDIIFYRSKTEIEQILKEYNRLQRE